MIGVIGVASGVAIGLLIACNLGSIVSAIEAVFHVEFLPQSIYLISGMRPNPGRPTLFRLPFFLFSCRLPRPFIRAGVRPASGLLRL